MPVLKLNLSTLPTNTAAWSKMKGYADGTIGPRDLGDQNSYADVNVLACALVGIRTGQASYKTKATDALGGFVNTDGHYALAATRNLPSVLIAADLLDYRPSTFVSYIKALVNGSRPLDGRKGDATLADGANNDPSNWGDHARAAYAAALAYLRVDLTPASRAVEKFLAKPGGFKWDTSGLASSWQPLPERWATLPKGTQKNGISLDGCNPEDARRVGSFPGGLPGGLSGGGYENYVREGMQGTALAVLILEHNGIPAASWGDRALLRSFVWVRSVAKLPFDGDDQNTPWIVNALYATKNATTTPTSRAKNFGFADWLAPALVVAQPSPDPCADEAAALDAATKALDAAETRLVNAHTAALEAAQNEAVALEARDEAERQLVTATAALEACKG